MEDFRLFATYLSDEPVIQWASGKFTHDGLDISSDIERYFLVEIEQPWPPHLLDWLRKKIGLI